MSFLVTLARFVSTTSRLTGRLVAVLCTVVVYVMLGLLLTQVLMRYFLGAPPSWTEELAIILFAWLVLLYATVGVRENFHVRIETIPHRFTRLRRLSDRIAAAFIFGFGLVSLVAGLNYVDRTSGQKSAALQLPIEALYYSVPVCGALLILHASALLLESAMSGNSDTSVTPA